MSAPEARDRVVGPQSDRGIRDCVYGQGHKSGKSRQRSGQPAHSGDIEEKEIGERRVCKSIDDSTEPIGGFEFDGKRLKASDKPLRLRALSATSISACGDCSPAIRRSGSVRPVLCALTNSLKYDHVSSTRSSRPKRIAYDACAGVHLLAVARGVRFDPESTPTFRLDSATGDRSARFALGLSWCAATAGREEPLVFLSQDYRTRERGGHRKPFDHGRRPLSPVRQWAAYRTRPCSLQSTVSALRQL